MGGLSGHDKFITKWCFDGVVPSSATAVWFRASVRLLELWGRKDKSYHKRPERPEAMLLQQVLHSLGSSPPSSAVAPLAPSVVLGFCPLTEGTEAYSRQAIKAGQSIVVALPRLQSMWIKKYHSEILPRKVFFVHVPMMTG